MVGASLMVISLKNPVHAVLFLIFAFFNAAGCFILIGAEFVAMTLIIVYVGAVAVLFLFVVMMLDIKVEQIKDSFSRHFKTGIALGTLMFLEIYLAISNTSESLPKPKSGLMEGTNTHMLGKVIYTDYFFAFQVAGLVLLVAMIGAILLTLTHDKNAKRQVIYDQISRRKEDCIKVVKVETGKGVKV